MQIRKLLKKIYGDYIELFKIKSMLNKFSDIESVRESSLIANDMIDYYEEEINNEDNKRVE